MTDSNPLLQAALSYAEHGWPVVPLKPNDKRPLLKCWPDKAMTDPEKIREWWAKIPDANIGLLTGMRSKLLVIDSDEKNGMSGRMSIRGAGLPVPETWLVQTPSGGYHYYYQFPTGKSIGSPAGVLDGVDIRGDGGYVVAPPSVIDGKSYAVASPAGIASLPSQWVGLLTKPRQRTLRSTAEPILDGTRNDTLASLAGSMRHKGFSVSAIEAALLAENAACCIPPENEEKVLRIARSYGRYVHGDRPPPPVDFSQFIPPLLKIDRNHTLITLPRVEVADLTPDVVLPPQEEIVPKHLPVGVPTLLAAHGGAGKSMLGLQLAVCVVAGREFMGFQTMRVPVTVYSAEDSKLDLRHRLKRIFTHYGINPGLVADSLDVRDVTDINSALYVEQSANGVRSGTSTYVYNALLDACEQNNSRLVIIDNASDVFEANENDRTLVRGFMRSLGQLARVIDGAVLLLAHVNKITAINGSRSENYSGSTAWHNSARSRLALTETEGGLILSHEKANRGERCHDISLSWISDGLLVPGHVQFDGVRDGPDLEQILGMFEEHTKRGDPVSTSRTNGNAYSVLSPLDGFPVGMKRNRFFRLMDRAEKDGRLRRIVHTTTQRKKRDVFEVVEKA